MKTVKACLDMMICYTELMEEFSKQRVSVESNFLNFSALFKIMI